jgi:hypothetical protein
MMSPTEISFSQLDITEGFGDDARLGAEDWIATVPLNHAIADPAASGLPAVDAGEDEVYAIASTMSLVRESVGVENDGVYCPVCHIANVQSAKLRTPCPQCGRELLSFGWE